jgi:hypothetical protein
VYRDTVGEPVFEQARARSRDELAGLLDKIIARLLKRLRRSGHLVEEEGMRYLADIDPDNPLTPLQAASCSYRIALGPLAGQKVLSLRTVPGRNEKAAVGLCADAHGFSLHAGVRCGEHQRQELERLCRYITRPTIAKERLKRDGSGGCRAAAEDCVARRHSAHQDVAAGIHAAPARDRAGPGAETK